jgi:hypothetical protein
MKTKYQHLNAQERNSLAWKLAIKATTIFLIRAVLLIAAGVVCYFFAVWADGYEFSSMQKIILNSISAIGFLAIILLLVKTKFYNELFPEKDENWRKNYGTAPDCKKVQAHMKDGSLHKLIDTTLLDWSIDVENPVIAYIEK